jgi:hypothetical protein
MQYLGMSHINLYTQAQVDYTDGTIQLKYEK